jgi:probable LLM family oxidoreductase
LTNSARVKIRGLYNQVNVQIGIDSFIANMGANNSTPSDSPAQRMSDFLARIEFADQAGLDTFGIGEHHRQEFLDSAPSIVLAAAAARTKQIRLTSAVTVLSAIDPVRAFQSFATLDLISQGRAEMVVGRGSFIEAFPLFGLDTRDYDLLFAENLDLLLTIRDNTHVHWSGQRRAPLTGQGVFPRPVQAQLPIWLGVGGTPHSFVRAGVLGLPLMIAIIGGETHRFRPLVDLYREAYRKAGHPPENLKVGLHCFGYVAETSQQAADEFYPGYADSVSEIGKERGWAPPSRASFEAQRGPRGAYLIGSPAEVADKIARHSEALGGVSRVAFQMDVANLPHQKLLRSIEWLGSHVAPAFRQPASHTI